MHMQRFCQLLCKVGAVRWRAEEDTGHGIKVKLLPESILDTGSWLWGVLYHHHTGTIPQEEQGFSRLYGP